MNYPFKVGETYENRRGEYEVVSIDEPRMEIRYVSGEASGVLQESSIRLQKRILENIQIDRQIKEQERKRQSNSRTSTRSFPRRKGKGKKFAGLTETDFQSGVSGTSWRARGNLGGLLAERLSDMAREDFLSYAVSRIPEVHIILPEYYERKQASRKAKFMLQLNEEQARFGFQIEKNARTMDNEWDWPRFISTLQQDESVRDSVEDAMAKHGLRWEIEELEPNDNLPLARIVYKNEQLHALVPEGDDSKIAENPIIWDELIALLGSIDNNRGCNLSLCTRLDKAEALNLGVGIANPIAEVFHSLLPLYKPCTH